MVTIDDVETLLDKICEGPETFNLIFIEESLPYGFRIGGSRSAAVTILDQPSKHINCCTGLYIHDRHKIAYDSFYKTVHIVLFISYVSQNLVLCQA